MNESERLEKKRIAQANYYFLNPGKQKASVKKWGLKNPEKVAQYKKNWAERNKWKYAAIFAKKKAAAISGIAGWADEFLINEIYEISFLRTKVTGIKYHVDHVVPLRSDVVCGLHCEANLQIVTACHNIGKRNYYWPDMPTDYKSVSDRPDLLPDQRSPGCYFVQKTRRWQVKAPVGGKYKTIGYFQSFAEAKQAYAEARE